MATKQNTVEVVLSADLANGDTFTVNYPQGTSRTNFVRGVNHAMMSTGGGLYLAPTGIGVALNATNVTISYRGASIIPAGTKLFVMLDGGQLTFGQDVVAPTRVKAITYKGVGPGLYLMELGNPVASAPAGICASQTVLAATPTGALLNGSLLANGQMILDVPRNVVAAWTNTAVLTVDGFDEYDVAMREQSVSGVVFTGVKAFKRITRVTVSADVTGLTVGTSKVLGLPVYLPGNANIVREIENLSVPAAGVILAGLAKTTLSTATTPDVRGTYAPSSNPDGSRAYALLCWLESPAHLGNPQFAG
jgi:hypothetical protein